MSIKVLNSYCKSVIPFSRCGDTAQPVISRGRVAVEMGWGGGTAHGCLAIRQRSPECFHLP